CFGNTDGFWVKLRSLGMDWLNHQSLIKKMMMNMVQDA
ncbi:MAG: binding 3 protein, partial [Pseudomonadota bacterium]|nr:binding 3 protein [Pseudomonadota bacterium]